MSQQGGYKRFDLHSHRQNAAKNPRHLKCQCHNKTEINFVPILLARFEQPPFEKGTRVIRVWASAG